MTSPADAKACGNRVVVAQRAVGKQSPMHIRTAMYEKNGKDYFDYLLSLLLLILCTIYR